MKMRIIKIVLGIIIGIVTLFLVGRIYHFIIIDKVHHAIETFKFTENRYYAVTAVYSGNETMKTEIIMRDNIVKYQKQREGVNEFCEWINFNENKSYYIDLKKQSFEENEFIRTSPYFLKNIPNTILDIYSGDTFNLKEFLKIKHIVPTKYNGQKCYKIITNLETIMIDQTTYLPVYSSIIFTDTENATKEITEYTYEFKTGEVTEEEVALPDWMEVTN